MSTLDKMIPQWISFRQSLPSTFPVLVQFRDEQYSVWYEDFRDMCDEGQLLYWMPFTPPAPPPRELDAFEQWMNHQGLDKSANYSGLYRSLYDHTVAAERERFAEGVERMISKWNYSAYSYHQVAADLRVLARVGKDGGV